MSTKYCWYYESVMKKKFQLNMDMTYKFYLHYNKPKRNVYRVQLLVVQYNILIIRREGVFEIKKLRIRHVMERKQIKN